EAHHRPLPQLRRGARRRAHRGVRGVRHHAAQLVPRPQSRDRLAGGPPVPRLRPGARRPPLAPDASRATAAGTSPRA
ncbi:MAG: hypothetical protein AVDCRST_MAG68-3584, partial [uncultured Gemmatimonadetes bacterium]